MKERKTQWKQLSLTKQMTAQSLRIDEIASTMKKQKNGKNIKIGLSFLTMIKTC
jgi:hypothetical protein